MQNLDGTLKKPSVVVHQELPHGVLEQGRTSFRDYRTARGYVGDEYKCFYFCPNCKGWIEGYPQSHHVNNLAPWALAGRSGYADDCERCGYELGFMGMVS